MAYIIKIKSRYRNDRTGREILLPALFTENGLLISHLRYLASKPGKSGSWRERSSFAIMLLVKYINVNLNSFVQTTDLLQAFSDALSDGTINVSTLEDPSGLYWSPRRFEDARSLLSLINNYTDWLSEQSDHDSKLANPFRKSSTSEQRLNWCAYYNKHNNIFLSHLVDSKEYYGATRLSRTVKTPQPSAMDVIPAKRFSESEIRKLLDQGFVRSNTFFDTPDQYRLDYKNQAITLLMHYGGLRKCEVLHLYTSDICCDRERMEAVVRMYHPRDGIAPDPSCTNRKDFLAKKYCMLPRNEYHKSERLHLGWKAPLISDRRGFFQVNFFPPEKASEFLLVWMNYLKFQRVDPPERMAHPYAFTNSNGNPETLKNFQRLHTLAVRRIGLKHEKYLGTTEHGHRHSYGYRLREHGFTQLEIQKAMHHKSPDSCLVYTQPDDVDLREKMKEAVSGFKIKV